MKLESVLSRALGGSLAALLALQATPAQARVTAQSASSNTLPTTVSTASHASTWVRFDGQLLGGSTLGELFHDPVIAWGAVHGEDGRSVPGQIWIVVAKNAKAIFYQLSEAHASGSASYSGYAVQTKAVQTQTITNFGEGADVARIGNENDAFITATSQLYVRSELMQGAMQAQSLDGTPVATEPTLVEIGTIVAISNVPYASSAARRGAYRIFAADGTLLDESTLIAVGSAGSSVRCTDFGQSVGDFTEGWIGGVSDAAQTAQLGMVGATAFVNMLPAGMLGEFAGGYMTATVTKGVLYPLTEGAESLAKSAWVPLLSSLAEGACSIGELGDDLLANLVSVDLLTVESTCSLQSVCTRYEEQVIGSTSTYGTTEGPDGDSIESVEVTGVTGDVCAESSVELVCEEQ